MNDFIPMTIEKDPINTQALIVGAGPVGLFQVFQLGLLEIKVHVVDALPHPGGQCVQLYPDKPIYDIPALHATTGRDLTDLLLKQIAPFAPPLHLGQEVTTVQHRADGQFDVATSIGTQFITQTIFIAAGVGAFAPRKLKLDGIDAFEGSQVHFDATHADEWAGQRVVVLGGDDAALEAALQLVETAQVTLVHRRAAFDAAEPTQAAVQTSIAAGRLQFVVGQVTGFSSADSRPASSSLPFRGSQSNPLPLRGRAGVGVRALRNLENLHITTPENETIPIPVDHLLVCLGLSPKLGPLSTWGLDMQRKQLQVSPETFATSTPGIFAVGDINTYPGKKKLILCGFHEATLAAHAAAALIYPEQKMPLQYTTTSARLHQLLGVSPAA